ncbi:MAG: hypothetical protein IJZ25_01225 [Lachnospiraceae bacterium]|nr:hypothetical protein [Lachnospiraceae bacterium]
MKKIKAKKIIKIVIIGFILLFWVIPIVIEIWRGMPHKRNWFGSYEAFRNKAEFTCLADELPESAGNTRYYWYKGGFVDKAGYHTKLSQDDYESMKTDTLQRYNDYNNSYTVDFYRYDAHDIKVSVQASVLEENGIDFWKEILPESSDLSDYYFLTYVERKGVYQIAYYCMICNDATNEIIEFSSREFNPNDER